MRAGLGGVLCCELQISRGSSSCSFRKSRKSPLLSLGGEYGARRMRDFFVRHLLGEEPPDRNGM